jgi:penicillin-binding protein 2
MFESEQKPVIFTLVALFLILFGSLFNLQIIKGSHYKEIAEKNYVRILPIQPVRGEIFDREYRPIVENKPSYNLYLTPGKIKSKNKIIEFVSNNFDITKEKVSEILYKNRFRLYNEILVIQDIQYNKAVEISEGLNYYPALEVKPENTRKYLYENHFSGYVGKINEAEFAELKNRDYNLNSIIGKTGLEDQYENILRGHKGYNILQVDSGGKDLGFFKHNLQKIPVNGDDLILTIDNDLQREVSAIFPGKLKGCVIVSDVSSGEILAYVSKPDFDPNIFVGNISTEDWNAILSDTNKPMLDRVIHGTYPPGSIYKPIIATLALSENVIDKRTKLQECTGGMQFGNRFFKCWYEAGHGRTNVTAAIKYSCDVFFYDLSDEFTLEQIEDHSKLNFLTVKTGIDLPGERKGFFPTETWFRENYGKYISITGQKVNLSIGQGEVLVSPLQMCAYYAALANNGIWVQPHLLQNTASNSFKVELTKKQLPVSSENIQIIQNSLYKTVNEQYGTGTAASFKNVKVYGKTGSAENHMGKTTHAWFAGYATWEEPEIAFTVFMENAGHGGSIAAPLAAQVIRLYAALRQENAKNP